MKIVVVGGGPVGLYAATIAARDAHEVTVVERRGGTIDKACGEGLMPAALAALQAVDVDPSGVDFRGIRYLNAGGKQQVHAVLPGGPGRGVRRTTLVSALAARAVESGVVTVRDAVVDLDQSEGAVALRLLGGGLMSAEVVLACDGLRSTIRRSLGLESPTKRPARYGLRRHFSIPPWSDDVEVYWGATSEAYVTPVSSDLVGVALLGPRGEAFDTRLTGFPALRRRLVTASSVGSVLGAGPMRRSSSAPMSGRVLLVGDAAGYLDALTGEGLAIGFLSARAAVSVIGSGEITRYADAWSRITRRSRWSTEALLQTTRHPVTRRAMLSLGSALPMSFDRAVATMA